MVWMSAASVAASIKSAMYASPEIVGWGASNNDDCKNGWVMTHNNLLLARMKTSCFYLYSGEGRIGVARTSPKHVQGGLKYYPALAPGKWLFDNAYKDYATYRERYFREILAPLDPQKVWDDLHALAGEHEPVLLCHEHYPDHKADDWCHRRMVAEWFEQTLCVAVPEMELPQHNALKAQASLF
jgi:hypothetical protein